MHKSTSLAITSLTRFAPKQAKAFNLLNKNINGFEEEDKSKNDKFSDRPITHWKPKITLNIVSKPLSLSRNALPGEIAHLLK
jgi:hypothetical protein